MSLLLKDPDAVLDYSIDWGAEYLGGDLLAESAWSAMPDEPGGLSIVGSQFVLSVRNLGYTRNAGEFVKVNFGDIGNAGGHRAMAKAVVPWDRFRGKFGDLSGVGIAARIGQLAEQFLSESAPDKDRDKEKDKDRRLATNG